MAKASPRAMSARRWKPAFSWLDVKLGLRMMRKYPGVSLAIVFALSIGIPVSLMPNHLVQRTLGQSPPFDEGERVVGVVGLDQDGRAELRVGDFEILRERARSFASLGAVIQTEVNVVSGDGWSDGESAALMTATVFTLARVQPIMGRTLLAADEVPGAPDVAVVGYSFWRRRLGGSEDVVGATIRVAGVPTTIVGVMPEGFAMPSVQRIWLPLRVRAADDAKGLGPGVRIYGRLADGVSMAQARAELRAVSLPAGSGPRAKPTQADAVPFSAVEIPEPEGALAWILAVAQVVPVIVLLVACSNAAILILARTATRWNEVAVRTVLGASRARIVGQLFVEALLLSLIATGIGLIAIDIAVAQLAARFPLPFWFDPSITPAFALKALGVSVLCAVVAGVIPALRATGSVLQPSLQSAGAGGSTLRLGRVAGALIVIEVGFAIVALFPAVMAWRLFQPNPDQHTKVAAADRYLVASIRVPTGAEQYLVGSFRIPASTRNLASSELQGPETEALRIRIASLQEELGRRLALQPGVRRWTFSDQPPGEERDERFGGVATFVDPGFFAVLDVPPVAGRLFEAGDVSRDPAMEPAAVIVNMKHLERRGMQPQSAIGSRFKLDQDRGSTPAPWKEIIGVVPNIEPSADRVFADGTPVVFMAAAPGTLNPMTVTIDLGEKPMAFASTLRSLVADVDPTAFVSEVAALDHLPSTVNVLGIASSIMIGLSLLAMALSATGLYALMSMTVAQRRREFGIRLALGGSSRGVMVTVARRALTQIAIGVAWGGVVWVALMSSVLSAAPGTEAAKMRAPWPYVLGASVVVVAGVALAAALWPTLRYIRTRPVETLRVDG